MSIIIAKARFETNFIYFISAFSSCYQIAGYNEAGIRNKVRVNAGVWKQSPQRWEIFSIFIKNNVRYF